RERSADVNERLTRVTPASARRLNPKTGDYENVAVAELVPGDQVRVLAGEIVPADGVIVSGVSSLDESLLTGESLPRACKEGDQVVGGSMNAESPLIVRVESVGQETVLSHMLRLMERAQTEKPAVAMLANRIAGWFVLGILSFAGVVGLGWYMAGSERWLEVVISLLVVTCPCALSLATPAAMTAATGALASAGMLVTRGNALESLSKITDFNFDKTGTLTDGELKLRELKNFSDQPASSMLLVAAALEADSEHLLGKALVAEALAQSLDLQSVKVSDVRNYPGQGVTGTIEGMQYSIGNDRFVVAQNGVVLPPAELQSLAMDGYSVVLLACEEQLVAAFLLGDEVRPGAAGLITYLDRRHIATHLLTGDTERAARRVAEQTGIRQVSFRMSPAEKLEALRAMQAEGRVVAMIGDGINDSPVLAGAQVSIAMGSAAQLAKFNADIVLVSNSLTTLKDGLRHAVKTVSVIRQNLAWALLYNLIAIPAAAAGYIAPWMAAIGMSLSSLLVVLNSARLRDLAVTPEHRG
ncbi:MAG: heavy metal translocating P-type ATPase, partial [Gammaproteobacteria bacterium]|nr:heavy metal translocating P-type ATPase [Gammaproteobacteria bacterium]